MSMYILFGGFDTIYNLESGKAELILKSLFSNYVYLFNFVFCTQILTSDVSRRVDICYWNVNFLAGLSLEGEIILICDGYQLGTFFGDPSASYTVVFPQALYVLVHIFDGLFEFFQGFRICDVQAHTCFEIRQDYFNLRFENGFLI